jgi:transposase
MDQRLQFVAEYLTGLYSMTELAASYAISRRIGYYWVDRYVRDGHLEARSRRPHTSPQATAPDLVERIRAARIAHPTWGAGKLRDWLRRREPQIAWPCRDTVHEVLRRHGLVRQRVRRRPALHPPVHLTAPTQPNLLWTTDYKGEFRTGDGAWCYPFTLRDGCTRYVLRCTALPRHATGIHPRLSDLWIARSHPQRQRAPVRRARARPPLASRRLVAAPRHRARAHYAAPPRTKRLA